MCAVKMVEAILTTRCGINLRGENCAKFDILPGMLSRFNSSMYDHKHPSNAAPVAAIQRNDDEENDDDELIQVLNDVEEMFGQPVYIRE